MQMILTSLSAEFGSDIKQVSIKNYKQIGETYGDFNNWKTRGYSTILDVLMVIIKHIAYVIYIYIYIFKYI